MVISQFHALYKTEGLSKKVMESFRNIVYTYFNQHGRDFPFRKDLTPYKVLVSEMMLQQTQAGRVAEKYLAFIEKFLDFVALSKASLEEVLKAWQGLGYNRRAVALKKIAEIIVNDYDGRLPETVEALEKLPNIGFNTASSIVAFAYNKPVVFIETNIRRVYIHFFFPGKKEIKDKEILPIVRATLDLNNSRKWYYALMDYGVMLKKKFPNLNKRSAHYKKQASFKGSNRQLRGKVLKHLLSVSETSMSALLEAIQCDKKKLSSVIRQLVKEGFLSLEENKISVNDSKSP
ncbi:MAG: A/G-specific adenine glycosylase [Promethearchaeota archaeon]